MIILAYCFFIVTLLFLMGSRGTSNEHQTGNSNHLPLRYSSAKKIPRWKRLIRLFISKLHFLSCKIFLELFPVIFLLSQYWLNYFLLYIFSEFHSKLLFSG